MQGAQIAADAPDRASAALLSPYFFARVVNFCEHDTGLREPIDLVHSPECQNSTIGAMLCVQPNPATIQLATVERRTLTSTVPSAASACLYKPKARGACLMSSADGAAMLNAMLACVLEEEHLGVLEGIGSLRKSD